MNISTYLGETKSEVRHVTWPNRAQTIGFTVAVIAISLGVAALLGAFDLVFNSLLKLLV